MHRGISSLYIRHYVCVNTQLKLQENTFVRLHQEAANEVQTHPGRTFALAF